MIDQLMRCPFCEESARIKQLPFCPEDIKSKKWVVGCDGKNGTLCPGYIWKCAPFYVTRDQAVEYWNHRASIAKADNGWISVNDRLPEEHESIFYKLLGTPKWSNSMWKQESEKVLVYVSFPDGTGVVTTGCLHNSDWMTTVSKALPQTVTHWMPLPKMPKEDKHET